MVGSNAPDCKQTWFAFSTILCRAMLQSAPVDFQGFPHTVGKSTRHGSDDPGKHGLRCRWAPKLRELIRKVPPMERSGCYGGIGMRGSGENISRLIFAIQCLLSRFHGAAEWKTFSGTSPTAITNFTTEGLYSARSSFCTIARRPGS